MEIADILKVSVALDGYGVPMIDPYGVYSPEYLNIIDTVQSFGFRHDPIIAEKMISDALLHAGATRDSSSTSGKWLYNGKPVTISILIRSDIPVSKSIGEAVASDLENIGFNVVRDYGDRDKANSLIYGSDPQDLKWNIYTESSSGITFLKYSPGDVASSYAPWNANMPGAQNPSYWNYKNSTLDIITIPNVASDIPRILRIGQPTNMVIHVNVDGKPSTESPKTSLHSSHHAAKFLL